jgi:hypothetical protein
VIGEDRGIGHEFARQHEIMTEIFVDGLQAQLTRQRPSN